LDRASDIVGTCSFVAPPDCDGVVKIAYFTFPGFEPLGVATAMAADLVARNQRCRVAKNPSLHIAGEERFGASARNLGFDSLGDVIHPEDGPVGCGSAT
jgi:hypothetical protein